MCPEARTKIQDRERVHGYRKYTQIALGFLLFINIFKLVHFFLDYLLIWVIHCTPAVQSFSLLNIILHPHLFSVFQKNMKPRAFQLSRWEALNEDSHSRIHFYIYIYNTKTISKLLYPIHG